MAIDALTTRITPHELKKRGYTLNHEAKNKALELVEREYNKAIQPYVYIYVNFDYVHLIMGVQITKGRENIQTYCETMEDLHQLEKQLTLKK